MITINGQRYEVLKSWQIEVKGDTRTIFTLKKPRGKKLYEAVLYSNNTWSPVV
jgi:hypothetical protein